MKTSDLKPCPFCGNREPEYRSEFVRVYNTYYDAVYVVCKCGGRTKSYIDNGRFTARDVWNRRANDVE